jgi:hypothetical protein
MKKYFLVASTIILFQISLKSQVGIDLANFESGKKKVYSTSGASKADGIKLKLNYPFDYVATESKDKDIVKVIKKVYGNKSVSIQLEVDKLPAGKTNEAEIREEFKDYKNVVIPRSAMFSKENLNLRFANAPACLLEYSINNDQLSKNGNEMYDYVYSYFIYNRSHLVGIEFVVTGPFEKTEQTKKFFQSYHPLFEAIMKEVVIE